MAKVAAVLFGASMRVRLVQIDGALPNLALMKLAHFYRARGDEIVFTRDVERHLFDGEFDKVYASAIFKFSAAKVERLLANWPEAIVGGTGTDNPATVESITGDYPDFYDYSLCPDFTASIGFTQRGCRLSCKFCVVPKKEGKPRGASTIAEIWRGAPWPKRLHLMDNDFFGGPHWQDRIAEIRDGDFKVSFTQGINVRAMTEEVAAAIASVEYRNNKFDERKLYTAWDNLKDEAVFFRGVDLLEASGVPPKHIMAYMLVGFDKNETWERIWHRFNRMVERGIEPYPMVYDCRATDLERYRGLKKFQRWTVTGLYRSVPFDAYDANKKTNRPKREIAEIDQLLFV